MKTTLCRLFNLLCCKTAWWDAPRTNQADPFFIQATKGEARGLCVPDAGWRETLCGCYGYNAELEISLNSGRLLWCLESIKTVGLNTLVKSLNQSLLTLTVWTSRFCSFFFSTFIHPFQFRISFLRASWPRRQHKRFTCKSINNGLENKTVSVAV